MRSTASIAALLACLAAMVASLLAGAVPAQAAPGDVCKQSSNDPKCIPHRDEAFKAHCKVVGFALVASPLDWQAFCDAESKRRAVDQDCFNVESAKVPDCVKVRKEAYARHCPARGKRKKPDTGWETFCSDESDRRAEEADAAAQAKKRDKNAVDDSGDAFGTSPSCELKNDTEYVDDLTLKEKRNCQDNGTPWRPHRLENYGLDNWNDPSVRHPSTWFDAALQTMITGLWTVGVWIINGAFSLLEWTFHLDLIGRSMPSIKRAMKDLHENALGRPWMLVALYVAGLWGIWNGLIRRRFMQTAGGLLATVLLMAAAMVVIYRPDDTVGELSKSVNDASGSFMTIAADGGASRPAANVAEGIGDMYEATIVPTWCVLQFGSAGFCDRKLDKRAVKEATGRILVEDLGGATANPHDFAKKLQGKTVEEAFLEFPAKSPERQALAGAVEKMQPGRANLMGGATDGDPPPGVAQGVTSRLGLLFMAGVALPGAIALLLGIAFRLVMASVMVLLLLLALPIMLLATAFGEGGRKAFGIYCKKLGGAMVVKAIYAIVLAVTILMSRIIAGL